MSATNWASCPKCLKLVECGQSKLLQDIKEKYGKIPANEWLNLLEKSKDRRPLGHTLREDYEVYTDLNGKFYIKYNCSCEVCGFSYEFNKIDEIKYNELRDI
tara:strand:- start:140 stop:445 length:306 start_codon:yes stop_codon:yes gene_type:complete